MRSRLTTAYIAIGAASALSCPPSLNVSTTPSTSARATAATFVESADRDQRRGRAAAGPSLVSAAQQADEPQLGLPPRDTGQPAWHAHTSYCTTGPGRIPIKRREFIPLLTRIFMPVWQSCLEPRLQS